MATKKKTTRKPPRDPYIAKIYIVSKWKGLNNYECLFCAFSTVDRDRAIEHYDELHAPPPPRKPRIKDTGLVKENGEPLTRVVVPKEK